MRILCLNLQQSLDPSCAEIFLKFSPRVQFRAPGYIFVDIESTTEIFNGEMQLLKKAVDLARELAPAATGAIAGSAPLAQVLSHYQPFKITKGDHQLYIISTNKGISVYENDTYHTYLFEGKPEINKDSLNFDTNLLYSVIVGW